MNGRKPKFKIPAGTPVEVRDTSKASCKYRKHSTRIDLYFHDPTNIGWNWQIYYFMYGDWEIAVNAQHLQQTM